MYTDLSCVEFRVWLVYVEHVYAAAQPYFEDCDNANVLPINVVDFYVENLTCCSITIVLE
jgi:hypothetical protein